MGVALPRALYPSWRHLYPPPRLTRRQRRHLQVEGLPNRRPPRIQGDATEYPRVHPPLPDARVAARLPPHPLLRFAHQPNPRQEYRAGPRVARGTTHPDRCHQSRQRFDKRSARGPETTTASLPLLRCPHTYHRALLPRTTSKAPPHTTSTSNPYRHLIIPTPSLRH